MSCCGRSRRSPVSPTGHRESGRGVITRPWREAAHSASSVSPPQVVGPSRGVQYRYVGTSRLVVEGPFSGRRYFFGEPGAEQSVDARDAPSLAGVPVLRRV